MAKLNHEYRNTVAEIVLGRLRVTAIAGAILFLLGSLMLDLPASPAELFIPLFQTRVIISIVLLVIAFLCMLPALRPYYAWLADMGMLFSAAAICWMVYITGGAASNYYQGLYIVLCAMFVVNSYSFRHNLGTGLFLFGLYFLSVLTTDIPEHLALVFSNYFFLTSVLVMVLLITLIVSRQHHTEYLQKQKIIETEKLKSEFFANVSHELRTPLTLILSPLEALTSGKYGGISEDFSRLLETMHHNTIRLLQMVTGLLDFSKLESKMTEVKREAVDAVLLTNSIVHDFQSICERKKLECRFLASISESSSYLLDHYLYERILFNLLSNAVKFTPEGGRIEVGLRYEKDRLYLRVSDTGIGIPEPEIKNLFQKFRQLEGSSVRRYEGTGLGLVMSREFARLLGGDISVENNQGKGTSFEVNLYAPSVKDSPNTVQTPKTPIREAKHALPIFAQTQARSRPKTEKLFNEALPQVLIAEDNDELAQYISTLIRPICRVIHAANGAEAFKLAEEKMPDLILSDVMMPEKDGFTLCSELKQNPLTAQIPVVLLTALTHRDALMKGWKAGADEYLFKPFHPEELITRIRSMLNIVRLRRQAVTMRAEMDQAMAHVLDASARFNSEGKCTYANRAYAKILGYQPDEIMAESWLLSVSDTDLEKAQQTREEMLRSGLAEAEMRGRRKNGLFFKMRMVLVRTGDLDQKCGFYVFLKDVTEVQYQQALEIKNEMLSTVSHELKTPLHILREGTRILLGSQVGPVNATQKDLLETSMQNLERMLRLVSSLLDYQKIETGIAQYQFQELSLNELIREAAKQIRTVAAPKDLRIEEVLNDEIPSIVADRDRIFQVISNLLDNAVKFTPEGKVTVRSILMRQENAVRIEVEDTGIGIEEKDRGRLFKNFSQLETGKIQAPFRGTGLGLAISKKIIEAHRGKIEMTSVFGQGSLFRFELPLMSDIKSDR
ncbi:MAG: response regulator [Candidatus Omnitrophica bacterium]|nr:response regulator [Candidatus Omnitrophota bacterium]